jgi:hypothetical protein
MNYLAQYTQKQIEFLNVQNKIVFVKYFQYNFNIFKRN